MLGIRQRFATALLPRLFGAKVPGHTTRAPPVVATNRIQVYAIANLDKTYLIKCNGRIAVHSVLGCSLVFVGFIVFIICSDDSE